MIPCPQAEGDGDVGMNVTERAARREDDPPPTRLYCCFNGLIFRDHRLLPDYMVTGARSPDFVISIRLTLPVPGSAG